MRWPCICTKGPYQAGLYALSCCWQRVACSGLGWQKTEVCRAGGKIFTEPLYLPLTRHKRESRSKNTPLCLGEAAWCFKDLTWGLRGCFLSAPSPRNGVQSLASRLRPFVIPLRACGCHTLSSFMTSLFWRTVCIGRVEAECSKASFFFIFFEALADVVYCFYLLFARSAGFPTKVCHQTLRPQRLLSCCYQIYLKLVRILRSSSLHCASCRNVRAEATCLATCGNPEPIVFTWAASPSLTSGHQTSTFTTLKVSEARYLMSSQPS